MFSRIAGRYDLMNRLMTAGQDRRWRRRVIERADLQPGSRLLDLGAGTGDLTRLALQQQPAVQVVAADFTLAMMRMGSKKGGLPFLAADALQLPFESATFDAVVSGFLMRNVADLQVAIQEQYRVLKSGGRMVILDTTRPRRTLFAPFVRIHLNVVIPVLGRWLAGDSNAYRYLPESTRNFVTAEQLAEALIAAGFQEVRFECLMAGTIAIHWGKKAEERSAAEAG